jgi:hypothetical protein
VKHYLMGSIFCLLTISIFSEEEKQIISVDDIDIYTSTNTEDILHVPDEASSQGGYIILEIIGSPPNKIAYPVEEALFMDARRKQ